MTRVGVESCCWWGDIKLLNQLTHLLKLQPLNNLSEATQCTEKCKTQFFQAYRKETEAMFSKFMGTELEEVPSSPTGPCVWEQQCEHPQKHQFASQPRVPQFPLSPMPWSWTASAKRMASRDLKEDGQQQQSKQEACRGWYCVGGELHNILANPSFQAAGSTTDSPATACPDSQKVPELPEQRSDANKNSLQAPR